MFILVLCLLLGENIAVGQHALYDTDTSFSIYIEPQIRSTKEYAYMEGYFIRPDSTPHINEEIIISCLSKNKKRSLYTDSTGKVECKLPPGHWAIYARRLGGLKKLDYFVFATHFEENNLKNRSRYFEAIKYYVYHWDDHIKLNIQFEPSKSTIKQTSYEKLDQVVDYLKRNKNIKIEIIGHTDNTGSSAFNLNLSKQRAKAVKEYLIKAGITPDRLQTDGKGDTDPIAPNDTEKGKAMNRRTELRILNE